jgi:hypothetical protein
MNVTFVSVLVCLTLAATLAARALALAAGPRAQRWADLLRLPLLPLGPLFVGLVLAALLKQA